MGDDPARVSIFVFDMDDMAMVGWRRFGIGFLGAVVVHAIAAVALVKGYQLIRPHREDIVPEFEMGISAVEMMEEEAVTPPEPLPPVEDLPPPQPLPVVPAPVPEPPVLAPVPVAEPVVTPAGEGAAEPAAPAPAVVAAAPLLPVDATPRGVETADAVPYGVVRPVYPRGSRQRGEEGRVVVEVQLAADGRATGVEVTSSSGFGALDRAAIKAAGAARFRSKSGGSTEGQTVPLTFRFTLESEPDAAAHPE